MKNMFIDDKNLSDKDFVRLSSYISAKLGINMPIEKKPLLQNRLIKRVEVLKMTSFNEYVNFIFSIHGSDELSNLIDLSTTNTTHFFREYSHFFHLNAEVIPDLCKDPDKQEIKIWCAGCSSGEEAYSLAICFNEALQEYPDMDFTIYATDLSKRMLDRAIDGIYNEDSVKEIPHGLKTRYFLKSKDAAKKLVRVIPEIRSRVTFRQLNFMESTYRIDTDFDIIFCRNVMIYFNRENQMKILHRMMQHLRKGGYFFNGLSEALINMDLPLENLHTSISRRC